MAATAVAQPDVPAPAAKWRELVATERPAALKQTVPCTSITSAYLLLHRQREALPQSSQKLAERRGKLSVVRTFGAARGVD